jgi:hypothetical protein
MNIDMRPIGRLSAAIVAIGVACIIFVVGMGTMAILSGRCECTEISSSSWISPGMAITCYDAELTKCDTIFMYKTQ